MMKLGRQSWGAGAAGAPAGVDMMEATKSSPHLPGRLRQLVVRGEEAMAVTGQLSPG